MLITPALLHVKTHGGRGRQDPAVRPAVHGSGALHLLAGLSADDILARLDVPVMDRGPEATEWDCIRADHAAMAEAGDWDDLLDALRFADQDRTMASGGRRVSHLISEGVRGRLLAALGRADLDEAGVELRRFQAVHALYVEDYAAVHLLAEAQIDIGLALLAQAEEGAEGATQVDEVAALFQAAEALLAEFDPIEEMSPLLAATRYRLLPGLADAASLGRDWYEDWCDLDPEDILAHAAQADFLLHQSGGTAAGFDKAARRAAVMTAEVTGKAAYAVFHLTAQARLGAPLPGLDIELLAQGLGDYLAATDCQHRANVAADLLTQLVQAYRAAGSDAAFQATKARAALSDVLWNRLKEVHLESWAQGADGLTLALAEVFGPALQKGARILRAGQGLGARVPRG